MLIKHTSLLRTMEALNTKGYSMLVRFLRRAYPPKSENVES